MNDTAALRAAAQRLVDAIEDDEHRSGGLLSRATLMRSAELRLILFETRVEADHHRAGRAPRAASGVMARTTSTQAQRRRAQAKTKAHFRSRERERRLSVAKVTASDAELIAAAVAAGRVRRVSSRHPQGEPEPQPAAGSWKKPAAAQRSVSYS